MSQVKPGHYGVYVKAKVPTLTCANLTAVKLLKMPLLNVVHLCWSETMKSAHLNLVLLKQYFL